MPATTPPTNWFNPKIFFIFRWKVFADQNRRCYHHQKHSSFNVFKLAKVSKVGQGDSNFSSEQEIVENFKLETVSSDGQWPGCIIYSQKVFATNWKNAKQLDGRVLCFFNQLMLDKMSKQIFYRWNVGTILVIRLAPRLFVRVFVLKLNHICGKISLLRFWIQSPTP